ncbi:MAG: hypothetical protein WBS20_11435 [Lysobacterales bacterium]
MGVVGWGPDSEKSLRVFTRLDFTKDCETGYVPTYYEISAEVQNMGWESLNIYFQVEDTQQDGNWKHMAWLRKFDLIFGLHDVLPRLGSGIWVSAGTPNQGLVVQQQDDTVVFYEMTYNRTNGEPNWLLATGQFHGNALNGVAYYVNWLTPSLMTVIPPGPLNDPVEVQPSSQELSFDMTSAGIQVHGINSISSFVGLYDVWHDDGLDSVNHKYKRWVFDLGSSELPPVVPDLTGPWTLFSFNGQELTQQFQVEFKTGTKIGDDLYHFPTVYDDWLLECHITLDGQGDCKLVNETEKLTFQFDLIDCNGNYAKGQLTNTVFPEPAQIGILLRGGSHLPVLDLQ